jgi:hypothetical protein
MSLELLAIHKALFVDDQSFRTFDAALDAGNEVVVVVNACGSGEFMAWLVDCRISDTVAV